MRRFILFYIVCICSVLTLSAQSSVDAKRILEATANKFEKSSGVKAQFNVEAFQRGNSLGTAKGTIELKGEKFVLQTADHLSWFNGKTQWTYLPTSDEVTVNNPTEAELQTVNPYALLSLYKQGYQSQLGNVAQYDGKNIYEVILSTMDKQQDLSKIVLYIEKATYQPLFVDVVMRDNTRNVIKITNYQSGLNYNDSMFNFDKKKFPTAEIIDLR